MASSAIKNEEEKKEFFDTPEELEIKIRKLAKFIRKSKHFIAFTGAGISTSCGIPDFRSGYNTVLKTGPGAWEVLSKNKPHKKAETVRITEAIPSSTHMAFVQLLTQSILKHIVSQNVDGLHRKSGVRRENLSELHGNIYIEKCVDCGKDYLRDHDVVTSNCATDHRTGGVCDNYECQGGLVDNIINFGENLDGKVINKAFEEAEKADLCLAMGSSLRVNPAATIPKIVGKKAKLVIVNLQKTPLDQYAKFVIHAFCDTVMEMLMKELRVAIPEFRLARHLVLKKDSEKFEVQPVDDDGCPFSYVKSIRFSSEDCSRKFSKGPFEVDSSFPLINRIKIRFQGHYGEPALRIKIEPELETARLRLEYNPFNRVWEVFE